MKFFVQTLFAIAALVFGFFMGVRYQTRVASLDEVHTLVRVQKSKLESLRDDNQRLKTVVLLREFLDRESIRRTRWRLRSSSSQTISVSRPWRRCSEVSGTTWAMVSQFLLGCSVKRPVR